MKPKNRKPTHPGEILLEEFLKPKKMTQYELAEKMGVPIQRVNTLVNEKRDMTPETAILLSRILGTTPQFWMNLQTNLDLYLAEERLSKQAA
ncbi:MAG: HigA family addiction module antidote protein [Candidatus Omnitrophica bacterium]|nr:HigA family addiction module antidote protein [Candidatus Omnitrophota bacterium]